MLALSVSAGPARGRVQPGGLRAAAHPRSRSAAGAPGQRPGRPAAGLSAPRRRSLRARAPSGRACRFWRPAGGFAPGRPPPPHPRPAGPGGPIVAGRPGGPRRPRGFAPAASAGSCCGAQRACIALVGGPASAGVVAVAACCVPAPAVRSLSQPRARPPPSSIARPRLCRDRSTPRAHHPQLFVHSSANRWRFERRRTVLEAGGTPIVPQCGSRGGGIEPDPSRSPIARTTPRQSSQSLKLACSIEGPNEVARKHRSACRQMLVVLRPPAVVRHALALRRNARTDPKRHGDDPTPPPDPVVPDGPAVHFHIRVQCVCSGTVRRCVDQCSASKQLLYTV